MRVVSALYHFCRDIMSWFRNSILCPVWNRCVHYKTVFVLLILIPAFRFTARLLWRNNDGNEEGGGRRGNRVRSEQDRIIIEDDQDELYSDSDSTSETPRGRSPGRTRSPANSEHVHRTEYEPSSKNTRRQEASKGEESERMSPRPEKAEDFDSEEYRVETTDELYCDYDSTWETDPYEKRPLRRTGRLRNSVYYKFSRFERAARDMQNYRQDYPNQINTQQWKQQANDGRPNLNFYLGKTSSVPDGAYITDFHNHWYGDYDKLEYVHTYIQWLFPLQEPGVNYEASTLTKEEIEEFRNNSTAKKNLLKSYKLMLDFYGIELCDDDTGEVRRADHWEDRFNNLNSHTHNSLRITRILKCLGNLGYPRHQAPLVRFFLEETLVNGQLPSIRESVLNYFMFAVLDKRQRRNLLKYAYLHYEPKEEFVWCPKKIQMLWSQKTPDSVAREEDLCNNENVSYQMSNVEV